MSITEKILELLNTPRFRYKGMSVNCFGLPVLSEYEEQTIKNGISNLSRKKYIIREGAKIHITNEGSKYIQEKIILFKSFSSPFEKHTPKNLLVLFDIPENKRQERDWFRFHLRKFDYEMIQRSVWVGPSPLPKEFLDHLNKLHLKNCIQTFRLTKPYTRKR